MLQQPIKLPPVHVRYLSPNYQPNGQPKIKFINPNAGNFERNIRHAATLPYNMIKKDELHGRNIIIAGSGPSLQDSAVLDQIRDYQKRGYLLCALKKAIKVLHEHGFTIDYSVNMDPGEHVACEDRIYKAPGVTYLVASSCDPALFAYLAGEKIRIFHSACGLPIEALLYKELFTDSWISCGGYNVTNRALAAFEYMGIERFVFAGVDGGWRDGEKFYADGTNNRPGVDMTDEGQVDGNKWNTRPDMLASSVALAVRAKQLGERIVFLGDVMPEKLRHKDDAFLRKCVTFQ